MSQLTQRITNPADFGKVAVLLGGGSAEREVSLNSGNAVLAGLLRKGVDAHPFDPAERDLAELTQFDRVHIALHGRDGEDGTLQGALQLLGVPYTGSGVMGSALGMDKVATKRLWMGYELPTAVYALMSSADQAEEIFAEMRGEAFVKPVLEGSSIGIARVASAEDLRVAWQNAQQYNCTVMVEQFIDGAEYTAAILNGKVLPMIRLEAANQFYDYEAKYLVDSTQYHCPCGLPEEQEAAIAEICLKAFNVVGCSSWGRVDWMMNSKGEALLLEVNTSPGMTDHSLVPMAAQKAGIDFDSLVWMILESSLDCEVSK
ncbi:MAG: D-alanine-D-alanine ligase [Gammaproteobacteria bacterium]|jgi:D-alanine-D-alanine ligase